MNRKLHNTILAFSVTGVMLFIGLVIAEPVVPGQAWAPDGSQMHAAADIHRDDVPVAAAQARARHFRADLAGASDPAEALAVSAGLVAVAATEVALQSALDELRHEAARRELAQADDDRSRPARRSGGSRDVIAVPYFSFARGSRGSRS